MKFLKIIFIDIFDFELKINRKDFLVAFILNSIFFLFCLFLYIKLFLYFNKSTFTFTADPLEQIELNYKNWHWIWLLMKVVLSFQFCSLAIKRLNFLNESKLWVIPSIFIFVGFPSLPLQIDLILILLMYILSIRFIYLIFIKTN
jgi:uncharacterized membrane protein YhaH (DUF805 family)